MGWSQVSEGVLLVGSSASHVFLEYDLLKARSLHLLQKLVKYLNNAYWIQINLLFHRPPPRRLIPLLQPRGLLSLTVGKHGAEKKVRETKN